MDTVSVIDATYNMMICPFRSEILVGQHLNEDAIPEQYQLTRFPECQYKLCPYYNSTGKTNSEKCLRVSLI